ncbi:MAG: NADH dehydrogenase [Bdellovibrionales bacterium RIFOXYD1_FULL_53_11]|nr:MAG: NADH dehydrogenase [Bdellovibrionales bacterium RIFOXYD1_FULL_53_11]
MHKVIVGLGSCGIAAGARAVYETFKAQIAGGELAEKVKLEITSCVGMCYCEPLVEVVDNDGRRTLYGRIDEKKAARIYEEHVVRGRPAADLVVDPSAAGSDAHAFLSRQKKIVLRNCGVIDPESLDAYIAVGGYEALRKAVAMDRKAVIETVKRSGVRGRGGAGFSTGLKWQFAFDAPGEKKYVVCNADEGDPGAFMDRSTLEGDPHSVLEGMIICAYAVGAQKGYIYCRAEYPLAVHRLKIAIRQASARGFLGKNILGAGFDLALVVKEGAGAFVCGEETALMASIEGHRGMPRKRPPFPAQSGLFGCPTNINNVETYANIPWVITNGADKFAAIGTEKSKGSKVFALAGKIKRGGLVEVPMGITIGEIVEEIGGGSNTGRPLKAVQLGGPSGGCIPASMFDTKVDYDEVTRTGAIMGSGGMLVMDETTCMVDVARFFLQFTQTESCGKCTFCRIGTMRMLEILNRITEGRGAMADLDALESLSSDIIKGSLCGLGQTAPNPVLTTLKYFRDEYVEHIGQKKCRAGVCKALIKYRIKDNCNGCTACVKVCPTNAITGQRKQQHSITQDKCVKCGRCYLKCNFDAIVVE